jgi:hypothetical protein
MSISATRLCVGIARLSGIIGFMVLPSRYVNFDVAGPEGDEEPSGKVLRLIQIRLAPLSVEKLVKLGKAKLSTSRGRSKSRTNA